MLYPPRPEPPPARRSGERRRSGEPRRPSSRRSRSRSRGGLSRRESGGGSPARNRTDTWLPSICAPSMAAMASVAASRLSYSTNALPLGTLFRSSMSSPASLIGPNVPKISFRCSVRTLRVRLCTTTRALLPFAGGAFSLRAGEREADFLSCLRSAGAGERERAFARGEVPRGDRERDPAISALLPQAQRSPMHT